MAAGRYDISLEQGATWRRRFAWRAPSTDGGTTPGPLRDLTDCTARMQLRLSATAVGPPLLDLRDGDGITLGGTSGLIDVVISSERTLSLTKRRAKYDLYVSFPGGDDVRVVEGNVTVDLSVTE